MANVFRVVFRLGLSARAAFAALLPGEPGWDTDTKVMRVGDDTDNPPKIPTSKSIGEVTYSSQFTPIFANVGILPNGKVDGVDLKKLIASPGVVVRGTGPDSLRNRVLEGDEYISVVIPDDVTDGSIIIKASEALIDKLKSSNLRFFYGIEPPEDARPGDMWFSADDEIAYLRVGSNEDEEDHVWLDFTSFTGGAGGVQFFSGNIPPATAAVGDEWYDKVEDRLYKFLNNNENLIWIEQA